MGTSLVKDLASKTKAKVKASQQKAAPQANHAERFKPTVWHLFSTQVQAPQNPNVLLRLSQMESVCFCVNLRTSAFISPACALQYYGIITETSLLF